MGKVRRGISEARRKRFLRVLGESCNVSRSAAEAGISVSAIYRQRAADASFRLHWREALATGYAQLEMAMLERALLGKPKPVTIAGESQIIQEYDDRIGLALLKMHRDTVREIETAVDGTEADEAAERILMRLRKMRAQLTGEVEVKQGIDRIVLLAMALKARRR